MPRLKTETIGSGNQSWLGSTHGISNARTETVDPTTFTKSTHFPDGYIPSGTPVALVGGVLVPYDVNTATTTGAGILAGHILTDQPTDGTSKFGAPLFDHGRVRTAKVPYASFAKPASAKDATQIVFI